MLFNVIDLELNQWKGGKAQIIEFGIAEVDLASGRIIKSDNIVIRPSYKSPRLTRIVREITGLSHAAVRAGLPLPKALKKIERRYRFSKRPWAAFGPTEMRVLMENEVPFSHSYVDVQMLVTLQNKLDSIPSLEKCLKMYGLEPAQGMHCASVDAVETARLLCAATDRDHPFWWPRAIQKRSPSTT